MLTERELNPNQINLTVEQWAHFLRHYFAMNELRAAYGKPLGVNSGIRGEKDQLRIYGEINARRLKANKPLIPVPMESSHLKAAATDFRDPAMELYRWCERNQNVLERLGVYVEYRQAGDGQVHTHCQTIKPKSGNRFFIA